MFDPSISDVRNFFFDVYKKSTQNLPLTDIEKIAHSVILEHPEYTSILSNPEKYLNYNWGSGETNPFLHLSLHLTIIEQLSIDQPHGIRDFYKQLCEKYKSEYNAAHELMDCLVEMLWQAQSTKTAPNSQIYLDCIAQKLGQK